MNHLPESDLDSVSTNQLIPIFPLPNAVLLPRTVLPLHVFEDRYRAMTRDALHGSRLIAMALLLPGYEATYHTLSAAIHPTVCLGRIFREERLPDGRYNFLLQGICRARVRAEDTHRGYRRGRVERLVAGALAPERECEHRRALRRIMGEPPLEKIAREARWLELLGCPDLAFSDMLDVLASAVLPCPEEKQEFLAEPHTDHRAERLRSILEQLATELAAARSRTKPRCWPPTYCAN